MHINYLDCYYMIATNDAESGDKGFLELQDGFDAWDPSRSIAGHEDTRTSSQGLHSTPNQLNVYEFNERVVSSAIYSGQNG